MLSHSNLQAEAVFSLYASIQTFLSLLCCQVWPQNKVHLVYQLISTSCLGEAAVPQLVQLMFALEINPPGLQVQEGRQKAAYLYHSALCKHVPFHTDGKSMDRQTDTTLPCSEERKGKEMQVFHMQSSLSFMFDLYKPNNLLWAVMGPAYFHQKVEYRVPLAYTFRHPRVSPRSGSFSPAQSSENKTAPVLNLKPLKPQICSDAWASLHPSS